MVVLSLQAVQLRPPFHHHPGVGRWHSGMIRCGITEASGDPAPMGQKTKYNDGFSEKAFMTLFARKMENLGSSASPGIGLKKKKGWLEYDYESFVDASRKVMQGRSRLQQQQVVREVLLSMLPPGALAHASFRLFFPSLRYLEYKGCVGMCINMCKIPTQDFFANEFGLPLTMNPKFEDMSCEMIYGQVPPPFEEDPASKQPCFAELCSTANPNSSICPKLVA